MSTTPEAAQRTLAQPQLMITTLTNGFSLAVGGPAFGWAIDGQPVATVDELMQRTRRWAEAARQHMQEG